MLEKIVWKDVIINCLSFSDETTSLINKQVLNWFSGYYITSVRSQIHNVDDITELLITNAIKWFADDCAWIPWAEVNNPVYQDLKKDLNWYNAFITPHIAWSTSNAIEHSNDVCIENIKQYIQWAPINLLY